MIAIILRIVLGLLAVGFIGWYLYITWLGLKTFFRLPSEIAITGDKINVNKKDNEKKEDNIQYLDHTFQDVMQETK